MKKAERLHLSRVADLGCIVCNNLGYENSPAEIHHVLTGCGTSQRASNYDVIPLCPTHHRHGGNGTAIHAGQKSFEKNFSSELDLLLQVHLALGIKILEEYSK